jgi:dTDP-4-dehydrorhamnose 3,5-epimerase
LTGQLQQGCPGLFEMKNLSEISGVAIQPLKQMVDHRGAVLHMLRHDSFLFQGFGEIYFSLVLPGVVKAWKRHRQMTQLFAVPVGKILLVLYDTREASASPGRLEEHILGRPDQYCLVRIPPLLWYGFQGLGTAPSLVANFTDYAHDPHEAEGVPLDSPDIPYKWKEVDS